MPAARALIRKLESTFDLTAEERRTIEDLPVRIRDVKAGESLVREGDRPTHCCMIIAGMACRSKLADEEGGRQIMSFHVSGDIPDLQSLHLDVMDHDLGMIQVGKVAFIAHDDVKAMNERHSRIASALWRNTLIDAAIFRQWMVGIGRKSAYGRVAHLICELLMLARGVGLAEYTIERTPTQEELGDALGLSVVHMNRTLRALRENGLIALQGRRMNVLDWEGLQSAGKFDPAYLHLKTAA